MNDRTNPPNSTPAHDKKPSAFDLAQRIAKHLTGPWTATRRSTHDEEEIPRHANLVRDADGATITVHVRGYRLEGRVTFGTGWPKYGTGELYVPRLFPSITCSAERDAKGLAKEIERRLLVDYDAAYRTALEEVRAADAADEQARRAAERIARITGAELPREGGHRQRRTGEAIGLHGPSKVRCLKVHPGFGDRGVFMSFEVDRVNEETTVQILALLAANGDDDR